MSQNKLNHDHYAEIFYALSQRVNNLIELKKSVNEPHKLKDLIDRQLQRTNEALDIVEKIIGE